MPNVFGRNVTTVADIIDTFRAHGDAVRGTYRARYTWAASSRDPYAGARLERPESLRGNPTDVVFPWEQIFLSAAACAGSDYPMIAGYLGVPLERLDLVVEGVFDPRGEFHGLAGFEAPSDAAPCFLTLQLRVALTSSAPRDVLEKIHAHVMQRNMVLGALRGIPRTDELLVNGEGK